MVDGKGYGASEHKSRVISTNAQHPGIGRKELLVLDSFAEALHLRPMLTASSTPVVIRWLVDRGVQLPEARIR